MPSQNDGIVRPAMAPIAHGDIGGAAARLRHQATDRHRQHGADEQRQEGQFEGRPEMHEDLGRNRSARPQRGAEIAAQGRAGPEQDIVRRAGGRGRRGDRSSAMRSGVTSVLAPSMIATASPGISRIIRKTMTDTPKSTTTRSTRRVRRTRFMTWCSSGAVGAPLQGARRRC